MAKLDELSERLLKRFKDVPKISDEDTLEWAETAMNEHGYTADDNVPTEAIPLVMLYAEADGASQIALRTSYYFYFTDKDETVDKTEVPKEYRRLADALWTRYRQKRNAGINGIGGSKMHYMKRVDRP